MALFFCHIVKASVFFSVIKLIIFILFLLALYVSRFFLH